MVNLFVKRGSMIVYTRGRVQNSDQDYRATADGKFQQIPMMVLVNRNSASASEIVAGALQDYDRALVVGETTFGKALVQSVYRVSQGAGLALTTARYFTPSGRMIQRPWDGSFDEYLTYTLKDQPERAHTADQLKYTAAGRKVYSGGGIEPDRRYDGPVEGFTPSPFARSLYARQLFAAYAEQFTAEGDTRAGAQGKNRKVVRPGFTADETMMNDFRAFVEGRRTIIDESAWTKDKEFIRAMLRYEIDVALFSAATARQRLIADDPQAQFALTLFPEAEKLLELRKAATTARVGQ
jgi:carboxyl-terminal processing protease